MSLCLQWVQAEHQKETDLLLIGNATVTEGLQILIIGLVHWKLRDVPSA